MLTTKKVNIICFTWICRGKVFISFIYVIVILSLMVFSPSYHKNDSIIISGRTSIKKKKAKQANKTRKDSQIFRSLIIKLSTLELIAKGNPVVCYSTVEGHLSIPLILSVYICGKCSKP